MADAAELARLLRCPSCRGALEASGDGLRCARCPLALPSVGGIPCVFGDPGELLGRWRAGLDVFVKAAWSSLHLLVAELLQGDVLDVTRARLRRLSSATRDNTERIAGLFAAAGITAAPGEPQAYRVIGEYDQLVRDWGWGGGDHGESALAVDLVTELLPPDADLGRLLVLGAGGCRLPYDLHRRYPGSTTIALDINPLPLLVARRVIGGGELALFELPLNPLGVETVSIERRLRAPEAIGSGFHFVLADGLDPPVAPGGVETVLTPWFIDQVPRDLPALVRMIHDRLAPGGRWINTGPLIYPPGVPAAARLQREEVIELVAASGFEVVRSSYRRVPYLQSPASAHGRVEHVLTFVAEKRGEPRRLAPDRPAVPWLDDPDRVVPRFAGLERYRPLHPFLAAVAAAIDGEASLRAITRRIAETTGVPSAQAEGAVRVALVEIRAACGAEG